MAAFRGAVRAGAHAIETDVHLSRDGVAVLSHDPTLNRCFGVDKRIAHCSWADLARLRVPSYPGDEGMPRLRDLLAWLVPEAERDAEGGAGHADAEDGERRAKIWILLDIKMDDDAQALVDAIAAAMAQVPPGETPWEQRILLGCWNASTVAAPPAAPSRPSPSPTLASRSRTPTTSSRCPASPSTWRTTPSRRPCARRRARPPPARLCLDRQLGRRHALGHSPEPRRRRRAILLLLLLLLLLLVGVVFRDPDRLRPAQGHPRRRPASPPAASAAVAALDFLVCNLKFKLVFLYRRFWLRKLDYLQQTAAAGVKQD
ncbi:hypothetical protein HIM_01140 [Hirsutella minnesotensis 3608]|nr:hypothetical protein HIM_01140 [Hirsutella minnesotensis 3608]